MRDEFRQSFPLLPGRSGPWIWITKPGQRGVKELICGRSLPNGALSVEGPAKNKLCRTIMLSSHPSEPMVDQCRLPDPSPGNDCDDVGLLVCPRTIQESDILLEKLADLRTLREHLKSAARDLRRSGAPSYQLSTLEDETARAGHRVVTCRNHRS